MGRVDIKQAVETARKFLASSNVYIAGREDEVEDTAYDLARAVLQMWPVYEAACAAIDERRDMSIDIEDEVWTIRLEQAIDAARKGGE